MGLEEKTKKQLRTMLMEDGVSLGKADWFINSIDGFSPLPIAARADLKDMLDSLQSIKKSFTLDLISQFEAALVTSTMRRLNELPAFTGTVDKELSSIIEQCRGVFTETLENSMEATLRPSKDPIRERNIITLAFIINYYEKCTERKATTTEAESDRTGKAGLFQRVLNAIHEDMELGLQSNWKEWIREARKKYPNVGDGEFVINKHSLQWL